MAFRSQLSLALQNNNKAILQNGLALLERSHRACQRQGTDVSTTHDNKIPVAQGRPANLTAILHPDTTAGTSPRHLLPKLPSGLMSPLFQEVGGGLLAGTGLASLNLSSHMSDTAVHLPLTAL